jgi:L-threonylcarbamoyladenylate synthase
VYGVAADLWQPEAVAALYAAKQRPPDRAIPILLSAGDEIDQVAERVPEAARRLAAAFWPGPLTVVVPKRPGVPEIVSALPTVGVRVPDHDAARAAIRACGGALAVTSANLSDQPSALTAGEAADALGEAVGLVLDGGPAPGGTPSTVVDATGDTLTVLRPGPIDEATLRAVVEG